MYLKECGVKNQWSHGLMCLVTLFVDHCVTCLWWKNVSNEECYVMEPMEFMECRLLVGLVNSNKTLRLETLGCHCALCVEGCV